MNNIIYNRVVGLCEEDDISLAKLENDIQLSHGSIRKWKFTMPSADKVVKIARYFDVSTDYLLGETNIKDRTYKDTQVLARKNKPKTITLTEKDIQRVVDSFKSELSKTLVVENITVTDDENKKEKVTE